MKDSQAELPTEVAMNLARVRALFDQLAALWSTPRVGRVAICSPLVGVIAGLGAVGFLLSLQFMYSIILAGLLHFQMPPTSEDRPHAITNPSPWWLVILVPAVGGLISGILVFTWAPEAEGYGTDAMIRAFHRGSGMIRTRVPVIKTIASIITIGTGGSAGQEGPIAQIGAGFGSWLARLLKLPPTDRRLLMLAGAAGGVGAIFRAPLGGALFAGEVLYSSTAFESAALLPCLASSNVACALNMAISRRWTIYEEQVPTPIDSPAHQGDFVVDILEQLSVSEVGIWTVGVEIIPASMPFRELIHLVAQSTETLFPVVDGQRRLTGIFSLHDLRLALVGSEWGPLVLADDLAYRPVLSVTPDDNLHMALRRMTELNIDEIPVVDPEDSTRLLGLLSRRALTLAYSSLIESLRSNETTTAKPSPSGETV